MEINGKNPLLGLSADFQRLDSAQRQNQRTLTSGEASPGNDSDRIELSVRGREIQQLDSLMRATPDIRENKVEQLRSAIDNGTYNVMGQKIADKIINGNLIDEVF